jgi:hypothetical protein
MKWRLILDNIDKEALKNRDKHVSAEDKNLQEFIQWMIGNISIRELLKRMLHTAEVKDDIWLEKELQNIEKGR